MSDGSTVSEDMVRAEFALRKALAAPNQGARLDAVMRAYWDTAPAARDAFVLVLAGNLTLRPSSAPPQPGAAA